MVTNTDDNNDNRTYNPNHRKRPINQRNLWGCKYVNDRASEPQKNNT